MNLEEKYSQVRDTPTDINEHVPTLYKYSKECKSVLELGVRSAVSSFAFIKGLSDNELSEKTLVSCDVNPVSSEENKKLIKKYCNKYNINYTFLLKNDLDITNEEVSNVDLTFIDTWHIYGQMIRELTKFAPITNKYIVMHDTELDKEFGETVRSKWSAEAQSKESGIPVEEILRGVWPAVEEFLSANPNWKIDHHVTNNNGLTVLKRNN
jgi:hypothetical protein